MFMGFPQCRWSSSKVLVKKMSVMSSSSSIKQLNQPTTQHFMVNLLKKCDLLYPCTRTQVLHRSMCPSLVTARDQLPGCRGSKHWSRQPPRRHRRQTSNSLGDGMNGCICIYVFYTMDTRYCIIAYIHIHTYMHALHCFALYCIDCITLHYTKLNYTTLHYIHII